MASHPRFLLPLAAVVLATIAGCGSSSAASGSQPGSVATPASTTSAHPGNHSRPVLRTTHSAYGQILSNRRGFALYHFTHDPPGMTTCYGACAKSWPPYLVRTAPSGHGPGGGELGAVKRSDGRLQVTYNGHPLYYYVGDKHPGQVLCQGVNQYGGKWLVLPAR
jgi:predicted lipoprotein with Yx(FWY)xxD motif